MNYEETINYLFTQTPMFQKVGAGAYKPGLDTVRALSSMFGNPHLKIKTIHVGGTNGKGSTAHTLAAVLQSAGYKVGLFTSPHLVDFRERIRINGEMISRTEVTEFVDYFLSNKGDDMQPSFFELTTIMAFDHFARHNVDVAVIEVGLGGRLDSTNIITPLLSIITNISLDHTALLGHTCTEIASEKAGIIKPETPVIIGESDGEVRKVFEEKAATVHAPIRFADDETMFSSADTHDDYIIYTGTPWGNVQGELCGDCQTRNAATIMAALDVISNSGNFVINDDSVRNGFAHVCGLTGLTGRWMKVADNPTVICDTGHNVGGWQYLSKRLDRYADRLHMVIGFVNDKDVSGILTMMPRKAHYHFVRPSVPRGLDEVILAKQAAASGLAGSISTNVADGYKIALSQAKEGDIIFVGGSTFVVANLIELLLNSNNFNLH